MAEAEILLQKVTHISLAARRGISYKRREYVRNRNDIGPESLLCRRATNATAKEEVNSWPTYCTGFSKS